MYIKCVFRPPGRHNISNYQIDDYNRMSQDVLQLQEPSLGNS
jgi:hypothetical protein